MIMFKILILHWKLVGCWEVHYNSTKYVDSEIQIRKQTEKWPKRLCGASFSPLIGELFIQCWCLSDSVYLSVSSRLIMCPFFFQSKLGSGFPFGGPHSRRAVSPAATRVSLGTTRNSSLSTATIRLSLAWHHSQCADIMDD